MQPARLPPEVRDDVRLLVVDASKSNVDHRRWSALAEVLAPGDLVVLNDSATIPASLEASDAAGRGFEVRLAEPPLDQTVWVVALGEGTWRIDTNLRGEPPKLVTGDRLTVAGLAATVIDLDPRSPRLLRLCFDAESASVWEAIYHHGQPVQYSHQLAVLDLWSFQTTYAGRPWSVEMPSAGRPLSWAMLQRLRAAGIELATVTHAAGLSATGDPTLDAALPLPERSDIPAATVAAVERTRARGGRVIALGTTVTRALEGRIAAEGRLVGGEGTTDLRLGPGTSLTVVDGIVTGMHEPGESHYDLLGAFVDASHLHQAWREAAREGYRSHEFGDVALFMAQPRRLVIGDQ